MKIYIEGIEKEFDLNADNIDDCTKLVAREIRKYGAKDLYEPTGDDCWLYLVIIIGYGVYDKTERFAARFDLTIPDSDDEDVISETFEDDILRYEDSEDFVSDIKFILEGALISFEELED